MPARYDHDIRFMDQVIIECLKFEMKISWVHFKDKISSFSDTEQYLIDVELAKLYNLSSRVRANQATVADFKKLFYEDGSSELNEFLQAMFDCFKDWQRLQGIELSKSLYEHTNRGTDNWFPVVLIEEKINENNFDSEYVTVYRGCNLGEYTTGRFKLRQSWSSDFEIAKTFAYRHPSSKTPLANRIVIKAKVKKDDILWTKTYESECVLIINFSPLASSIEMTYEDFKSLTGVT
jgi:hypothetical protein